MTLNVGLDDIATETSRCSGWTAFVLPEALRTDFDRKGAELLAKTKLRAFHGKDYKRRFRDAYVEFVKLIYDTVKLSPQARAASCLISNTCQGRVNSDADTLIAKSAEAAEILKHPDAQAVIDAAKQCGVPALVLVHLSDWLGLNLDMTVELDTSTRLKDFPKSECVIDGTRHDAASLLSDSMNAFRDKRFPRVPRFAQDAIQLVTDEESLLVQAADIIGNFSLAYVQKMMGRVSKNNDAKAAILAEVMGEDIECHVENGELGLEGDELTIVQGDMLTFEIRWTIRPKE